MPSRAICTYQTKCRTEARKRLAEGRTIYGCKGDRKIRLHRIGRKYALSFPLSVPHLISGFDHFEIT